MSVYLIGVYFMNMYHRIQPFYLVVRAYLRLLVVLA